MQRRKYYDHAGRAGCVDLRCARTTGTVVGLYNAVQADLDHDSGPWVTVCEDHGSLVHHDTLSVARSHQPHPKGWCEDCRREGERIHIELSADEFEDLVVATRLRSESASEAAALNGDDPVYALRMRALLTKLEGLQR